MPSKQLSVIAPCFNEEGNVGLLVDRLLNTFASAGIDAEIVLVNDASRDRTGELIEELASKHPEVIACHHPVNRGIEGGWLTGVENSRGHLLCFIDSDLQNRPEDVARLYQAFCDNQVHIVQGWRSSAERMKDIRYILSKGLNMLLNGVFGMHAKDNKSGFILAPREVVEDILKHRLSYYCYQSMIMVAAHNRGYLVHEIETCFDNRHAGQSFIPTIPWKISLKCLSDLATGFYEFRLLSSPAKVSLPLPEVPVEIRKEKSQPDFSDEPQREARSETSSAQ